MVCWGRTAQAAPSPLRSLGSIRTAQQLSSMWQTRWSAVGSTQAAPSLLMSLGSDRTPASPSPSGRLHNLPSRVGLIRGSPITTWVPGQPTSSWEHLSLAGKTMQSAQQGKVPRAVLDLGDNRATTVPPIGRLYDLPAGLLQCACAIGRSDQILRPCQHAL